MAFDALVLVSPYRSDDVDSVIRPATCRFKIDVRMWFLAWCASNLALRPLAWPFLSQELTQVRYSSVTIGLLLSTFSLAAASSSLFITNLINTLDKRIKALRIGLVVQIVTTFLMGFMKHSISATFALFAILGVASGVCENLLYALVDDLYSGHQTLEVLSIIEGSVAAGYAIGPAVASIIYDHMGYVGPFIVATAIIVLQSICAEFAPLYLTTPSMMATSKSILVTPKSDDLVTTFDHSDMAFMEIEDHSAKPAAASTSCCKVLSMPVAIGTLNAFLCCFALAVKYEPVAIYYTDELGLSPTLYGLMYFGDSIVYVGLMVLLPTVLRRFGPGRSSALGVLGVALMQLSIAVPGLIAATPLAARIAFAYIGMIVFNPLSAFWYVAMLPLMHWALKLESHAPGSASRQRVNTMATSLMVASMNLGDTVGPLSGAIASSAYGFPAMMLGASFSLLVWVALCMGIMPSKLSSEHIKPSGDLELELQTNIPMTVITENDALLPTTRSFHHSSIQCE